MLLALGVEILEVGDERDRLYPTVLGGRCGYALVDSGFPGMTTMLEQALQASGRALGEIGQILLTHQDLDHIGGVNAIRKRAPMVKVWAHADDVPYMDGTRKPLKLASDEAGYELASPERREFIEQSRRGYAASTFAVDRKLAADELLEWDEGGPVRVLHAPGHTPGHIMLFVEQSGVLITGDALIITDGELAGPLPEFAADLHQAYASLRQLLHLPIRAVAAYHGGVYHRDVQKALRRIIEAESA